MHLDPLVLPEDWTPDQAFAVAEFLIALHDAIWDGYGRAFPDTRSGPPPRVPEPAQLALPVTAPRRSVPLRSGLPPGWTPCGSGLGVRTPSARRVIFPLPDRTLSFHRRA